MQNIVLDKYFLRTCAAYTAASAVVLGVAVACAEVDALQTDTLALREGTRNAAYLDTNGTPTICTGHTSDKEYPFKMGDVWSDEKCAEVLEHDFGEALTFVDNLVTVPLETHQRSALASFVFNIGGNAFRESTLLRKLNAGDYAAVPDEMRRWRLETRNGVKVVSRGLVNRREQEIKEWLGG